MIRRSERNRRWPNLFVVGAAKAGTTSLAYYLGQHPDIFMSPIKEPHFFSGSTPTLFEAVHDERAYLRLFDGSRGERYLGEASPSYLDTAKAAQAIARAAPEARIVISLRNPIDRAYSDYWGSVRLGETRPFFELVQEAVACKEGSHGLVRRGTYAHNVERYLSVFGPDRVRVLFFEELVSDVRPQLTELFRFLGIDFGVAREIRIGAQNPFSLPRGSFGGRLLGSRRMRRAARRVVPCAYGRRSRTSCSTARRSRPWTPSRASS